MRKNLFVLSFLSFLCFSKPAEAARSPQLTYEVNLNDRADDLFKVSLVLKGLKPENNIFQFAATAPGTYQTMDIGRFVRNFKAFDKKGRELETKQVNTNQWELSEPGKTNKITYQVAETWDTPVDKNKIYGMCGTSLEQDHALINGQGVFGYIQGLQASPMRLKLQYPAGWEVGTALKTDKKGYYQINNFDHVVDSPILAGNLTKATTNYSGTSINIYTYSKTGKIKSPDLLNNMTTMLDAVHKFVVNFPVDQYTFLFHFEDVDAGAWEHSYSSEYVMREADFTPEYAHTLTDIASHEFFHIITPLNIHSEIIQQFNFVTPTPSQHLWLYEGTTEWASDIMQLRAGMIDLSAYLKDMQEKLQRNDLMGGYNYSLQELSLTSYTPQGQQIYGNIYARGAATAALLDIRLLELSGGKRGLREVINELSKEYGPTKAFPEQQFFDIFTAKTYPEIADFFNRYVKGDEPLPVAEYFGKLGIRYTPVKTLGTKTNYPGFGLTAPEGKITIVQVNEQQQKAGLANNDELVAINGTALTLQNANQELPKILELKAGENYTLTVKKAGKEQKIKLQMLEKQAEEKHLFEIEEQITPAQMALRQSWMKNQ